MGTPCSFAWIGDDPDGMGEPVLFSYRLDSNPFSDFAVRLRRDGRAASRAERTSSM